MRALVQRVTRASVVADGEPTGAIGLGVVVLLGIETADTAADIPWLVAKISALRIFPDEQGVMNRSLLDVQGEALIVSQFTLHASTKKGNRPSYIRAARPEQAIPLYQAFVEEMRKALAGRVATGKFGADMQVELVNNGPVTLWIDTLNRE